MRARRESSEDIGYDPFNLNSDQSDQGKVVHLKMGTSFFETFLVGLNRSIESHCLLPPPPTPNPQIIFCFNLGSAFAALKLLGWARFGRRSFHKPSIKFMKGSSESIKEHLFQFGTAQQFFNDFGTILIQTPNFSCTELNA